MRRTIFAPGFIGRLVVMMGSSALAMVILGATAFAQGDAAQDQYTNEPTQSEPSTAPATDTPAPDSAASSSPDASPKSPPPETTASSSPDASQKSSTSDSTAPATDPPTSESTTAPATETPAPDTTAPSAPNASQNCPWEPIPPGAYPGGPSGCPWWRGTPGGSSRVHPTRGQLPEGQCYDTQLGVTYSCSGASQPKPSSGPTPPQSPPGPKFCVGGQSCDGVPNPGPGGGNPNQLRLARDLSALGRKMFSGAWGIVSNYNLMCNVRILDCPGWSNSFASKTVTSVNRTRTVLNLFRAAVLGMVIGDDLRRTNEALQLHGKKSPQFKNAVQKLCVDTQTAHRALNDSVGLGGINIGNFLYPVPTGLCKKV
jgi:hypothetical protein